MISLFNDTELLDPGRKRFVRYPLPETELMLWEQFVAKDEADRCYRDLLTNTPWAQHRRKMYDRIVADPRLTAWYGNGSTNEWSELLVQLKKQVEKKCNIEFNSVLLNYYRDGNDSVAWHSDMLPSAGEHHPIASLTFGETRMFKVRHKTNKEQQQLEIPLTHGALLLMGKTMQYHYEHHIPKTKRVIGPRINLTFRISDKED